MLGRLIQGYSRGGQLESATEETHTRTLLWPEVSPDGRYGSLSPPATPFGSPVLRASPFDDRAGLDLNETKDLRVIIAQDAFGTHDRPMLLYDTQTAETISGVTSPTEYNASPFSHTNTPKDPHTPITGHIRNRSSTMSGSAASWARPHKDSEPTDHLSNVLDCMFGVSSATKSGASTKIHVLPGERAAANSSAGRTPSSNVQSTTPMRAPLVRAKTSGNPAMTPRQTSSPKEAEVETRDSILITRIFPVTLPESKDDLRQHRSSSAGQSDAASPSTAGRELHEQGAQGKKPKLVEKKTPVYAIGLLFYLPRHSDNRPGTSAARPASRASFNSNSTPASYGSDASWIFLNAIPDHLFSPEATSQSTDRSMGIIVQNWDVILRSLSVVEQVARAEIGELLQQVNLAMISSAAKAPKGPSEQRTNQRNVYLRSPNLLAEASHLRPLMKHALGRISYALRIPRVLTGFGLDNGGHWLDEARYLVRLCGNKQQNFFLFNLLTAFLGNHTEWLERLGPDWYRKQIKALNRSRSPSSSLASRTIIICDNRSMARRLIFLLATFLPRSVGTTALAKVGGEYLSPLLTPDIESSSPAGKNFRGGSMRRHIHTKSREGTLAFSTRDISNLSTSVSSTESVGGLGKALQSNSRSVLSRPETDLLASKQPSVFTPDGNGAAQKTDTTSSTATPGGSTPVPYFSAKADSYFPDGAIAEADEGSASADLARILRRDSISHPQSGQSSINWGSLISNVSGLWSKKGSSSSSAAEASASSAAGSLRDRRKNAPQNVSIHARKPSQLERMVNEASNLRTGGTESESGRAAIPIKRPPTTGKDAQPPRLTVDDKDGVVDVDISLPGFIGWTEGKFASPASSFRLRSPSITSTDDAGSFLSHNSKRNDTAGSKPLNVAGFLRRYHEDFILQGVKPYPDLKEEVRQSMARELTPPEDLRSSLPEERDGELWVNVCTTLLADCRTFTIQRLTLQRRIEYDNPTDKKDVHNPIMKPQSAPSDLRYRRAPVFQNEASERFVSETVMDFDSTLTDAIERVLNEAEQSRLKSMTPSRTHSRAVSTASSARSEPLDISGSSKTRYSSRSLMLSQTECRQAVVGALEEVVKSVNDDLAKHHRSKDADGSLNLDSKALEQEMKQDNILREGVKKWLLNVETRSVW
ncbi:uncharacterized protein PV06_05368 [Exophiala oligosperma]|uniref:Folliculin-interacting protein N-terminal domain-containing protein n=1 Tax=Exophiala oligosperma TaxID=215243 RepID=A0A0D2E8Y1_9EURO|nr:uncharacterized protein PV06_05368 [Exophiala oligosperma]KIW44354.1 hypothetical protein PV06_05368 [Exophiala oligosperma]